MTSATQDSWYTANQRYLAAALDSVRAALQQHVERGATDKHVRPPSAPVEHSEQLAPPALATLRAAFRLSPFERDLLLLCAGVELEGRFAGLCAAAHGNPQQTHPTFSLALAALAEPHWSAITPAGPLRRWRLIEISPGSALTSSPLRIDERVLHYLAGVSHLDERLAGIIEPARPPGKLVPSHAALAERIATIWSQQVRSAPLPMMQLLGNERAGKRMLAAAACETLGLKLHILAAEALPSAPSEIETLIRLWEREAALIGSALFVDCEDTDSLESGRAVLINRLIERIGSPVFVASRERRQFAQRMPVTFDIGKPSPDEQRAIWQQTLGDTVRSLNGHVDQLVSQFNLSALAIQAAGAEGLGQSCSDDQHDLASAIWNACRIQARPRLDDLAQRIEPAATWEDLVLPEGQRNILRDIAAHVRQRARVYERWGFANKGERGLGISALFSGASGTGKTTAAEVLAGELQLDLYRIDLSAMVSKYIGETEKNLRRVFDAAEEGGTILLFDEADALFGKRSEVKDSHDRYANIEVSYLLQRMESYRGLAIMTTNLKSAIDQAFMRRIRFVVQFPFPDAAQRAAIWRRVFPQATPTEGLNVEQLARLNIAGGNIRNIALNAAFLAADAGEPVRMVHLLRAARGEYAKLEKPLTDAEITGWI